MKGHIQRRGKRSWRLKFDQGRDPSGKRLIGYHTTHGTKRDAQRELNRILHELDTGAFVEPSKMLVANWLRQWLSDHAEPTVSPKTFERYSEIVELHLIPALGQIPLAKLRLDNINSAWAETLKTGRRNRAGGLSAQTVIHHHRVLPSAAAGREEPTPCAESCGGS